MSVEQSCATRATKSAGSSPASHTKGKSHPAGGGGLADTGGFSSLLMTLGSDEAGDSGVGLDLAGQPLGDDESLLDPGMLLAQSMQLQSEIPKANNAPGARVLEAAEAALRAVKTELKPGMDALHSRQDTVRPADVALLATEQGGDKLPISTDVTKEDKQELPLASRGGAKSHAAHDALQVGKGRLAAEEHANRLIHADNRMAQSVALPQMALATGVGEPGTWQTERATERFSLKQIGGSEGGAWGHQALVEAGRIDPPAPTTGASVLTPEMMVAEQVNYWVGRDVQNAELKLDGLGDSPVKVSISLQGNEARIEFRTDQVETRQVLEGAVSHLKDLLGSEGLVLSSVSVGSSGSGGGESRDRKSPPQSRQVAVAVPEAFAVEAAMRPGRLSGRTVDLFV